jgi:hypothetical protein
MSVRIRRVVVAGVVAAAAVAIPVAALASGSGSPSAKPSPPAVSKSPPAASKAAGSGTRVGRSLTGAAAVAALASGLGVSTGAARHALQQIGALSGQGGVDPTGPAFAAIARGLGVSPAQLAAALGGVKHVLAGQ